ncbi:MAG: hypothetical protein HOP11_00645 [Saprospiraceae bacterium]|nr:hypothetical protein [Saprospiraceae bacterium]
MDFSILFLSIFSNFLHVSSDTTGDWKTYKGDIYSIHYPSSWEFNKGGHMNTHFILMSPTESTEDKLSENVNLIVQDMGNQPITLSQYVGLSTAQVTAQLKDGTILLNERKSINDSEYHHLIYSGKMGDLHLVFNQHVRIKDNNVYVLTFTCEFAKMSQWQTIGEEVMKTFSFN